MRKRISRLNAWHCELGRAHFEGRDFQAAWAAAGVALAHLRMAIHSAICGTGLA